MRISLYGAIASDPKDAFSSCPSYDHFRTISDVFTRPAVRIDVLYGEATDLVSQHLSKSELIGPVELEETRS